MPYTIKQQLISMNRPKEKFINLKGIVIHSTANIGATSLNHYNYWNNGDRQSSIHYIADWIGTEIYQFIPENEIAWHTGSWQGNREWLGIEMAETNFATQFDIVWNKTVWFVADVCIRHNWNVDDNVWSHNGLRSLYAGVDHTDPYGYLTRMGKTWKQLCDAIDAEIKLRKSNTSPPSPTPSPSTSILYRVILDSKQTMAISNLDNAKNEVVKAVDSGKNIKGIVQRTDGLVVFEYTKSKIVKQGKIVVYIYEPDSRIANYYANYFGIKAIDVKEMTQDMWNSYEEIIQIGGKKHNSNVTLLLSGNDAFDTIVVALKHAWNIK